MTVSNIKWVTNGEDVSLPSEVEVDDNMSDYEIANYLSNSYGWFVEGFSLPMDNEDIDKFGMYINKIEGAVS